MTHVLIGFAEALPAPEVYFSLMDAGLEVSVFCRSTDMPMASLPFREVHVLPAPEKDAKAAIDKLKAVMSGPDAPDRILPLDDNALWLCNAALGEDFRIAGATGFQARVALDKELQIKFAQEAGLNVPDTLIVRDGAALGEVRHFPSIAKPSKAVFVDHNMLGKGAAHYLTKEDPCPVLSFENGPFIVQPLIQGTGEGVFGFASEAGVVAWSGHRRLRMMNPHGSGSSACFSITPEPELREATERFIDRIGWSGPFMVELLRDGDGTPWFMELNGRMWGSMALARRQGFEYPSWGVKASLDPAFIPSQDATEPEQIVVRNLGRDILHLLFVLRGPKSGFHKETWPGFWSSLIGVLKPAHLRNFYNYDRHHKSYFLRDALWTIRRALRR